MTTTDPVAGLSDGDVLTLAYDWTTWARPEQLPPGGDWAIWLILAGRGWGKTRTGVEFVLSEIASGRARRVALVGRSAADVRDVMIEGESGILACSPPWSRPLYEPSKRRLSWPNGAIATGYSADEPDQLRGPQHDCAWSDEIAAWKYPGTWDQLQFGLRLGQAPRQVVTTTPRPTEIIRQLVADEFVRATRGKTLDNAANLAPAFLRRLIKKYDGTRLGRQELEAEILGDTPGALWNGDMIAKCRKPTAPELVRVVVGVDPSASLPEGDSEDCECGIVVGGVDRQEHAWVVDDRSGHLSPLQWAKAAIQAYKDHRADRIVAEANQGGEMVRTIIHQIDHNVPVTLVHATRGKLTRAEPVQALYEQDRVHHVGTLAKLEDQLTTWVPGQKSPDRLDALVWTVTELLVDPAPKPTAWRL